MPNYTYRCLDCNRHFTVFMTYAEYGSKTVTCRRCGSERVQRRIRRVRMLRSEESRLESLADLDNLDLDGLEDDPRALGRLMRRMSDELGEDLGPEFDEVVDRLEAGQSPEEIEKELPELAEGGNFGDDLGGGFDDDF